MDHNPDRLCVWPGYFDMKRSRRAGRRVPKDASVLKPDLEGLFNAARAVGLRKIKREEHTSHPRRPHGREGRLWVSSSGAKEAIGAGSKEELLQLIGGQWREMQRNQRQAVAQETARGPKTGDRRARSQRKNTQQRSNFKKRKSFKNR
ncbi:MAG: signal recognition particle subunit SRP19/SEC65 family protein [Candidatus Thermoplasmatota archaeon]|nr:signal recognition particle subunit SRP19/SEC65 family protein [Candidatus Thermoplasmatota archaeon]MEE2974379.1 signal recognition particle subunit SRP19/SEC65 family protein [Candidatus Thermoplasmatota archaeon]